MSSEEMTLDYDRNIAELPLLALLIQFLQDGAREVGELHSERICPGLHFITALAAHCKRR